jgi:Ca2+-binding EF-hand superfamily protein
VTPERTKQLEDIIFEKIRQRTHGADDEGKTVKKIFKHNELQTLFVKFDANGNGKLDYEEFASFIARMGSGNNPNVNPVFGITREPPNQVIDKIKVTLKARGSHGIRQLGQVFRRIDNSKDHKLDRSEFQWGLRENGHVLSPSEFERIFKYFDKNNDGKIDYDEFLRGIRGHLNERRRAVIQQAYQKLDKTGD